MNTKIKRMLAMSKSPYISLPQYLLSNQGTEFENFDSVAEWTEDYGGIIADNNNEGEYRSSTSSIKMTTINQNVRMYKTIPGTIFSGGTRIKLYVYLYAADFANLDRIYVAFAVPGYANYVQASFWYAEQNFHAGWNALDCPINRWSLTGINWAATFTLLRVWLKSKAGTECNASIDSLVTGVIGVPAAMITFDDGLVSVYSKAFAYMKTKRARGTFYINTSLPGTSGSYITVANLQEMDAARWSIANHSDENHTLVGYTQAEVQGHIAAAKVALDGWGLSGASNHLAYPLGDWDDTVIAALKAESFLTGRTIRITRYPSLDAYEDDLFSYKIYTYPGSTFAAMKIGVDNANIYNHVYCFVTHAIPGDVTEADFYSLIDYIVSLKMPFITINDLYDSLSGPIIVPIE